MEWLKCHVRFIPTLNINVDKTGYNVTASSQQSPSYAGFKAFRFVNAEWATAGETNNFYLQIQCPELVRVWIEVDLRGRDSNTQRIFKWNIHGSTDGENLTPSRLKGNLLTA